MEVDTIDLEFQGVEGGVAAFLATGPDGGVLVETGPESTLPRLLESLAERGLEPGGLKAVFVTHIHLDHAGAAGAFAAAGVPVYVHARGARHLAEPSRLVESARSIYGDRFERLWGGMRPVPEPLLRPLSDGDSVSVAGLVVTARETPGHAFHHHAYQIEGTVFTGDAAGARLGRAAYLSVTAAPPQFHLEHTVASLGKLASLAPDRLFLTHFGEVADPSAHLAAYRDAVELNAEFVRRRLREGMEGEALAVAYEAFQLEQAYRLGLPAAAWADYETVNGAAMCADGIRRYWEARFAEEAAEAGAPREA